MAPVKVKHPRTCSQSWLNDSTRALRRTCRQAERKWKKDKLQVSFDILRMSRLSYQESVKMAKAAFMSAIITANSHNPRMLFKTFNSVVNPRPDVLRVTSPALCEHFLVHFTEKNFLP